MRLADWLLPESCAHCREDVSPDAFPLCAACVRRARALNPPHAPRGGAGALRLLRAAFRYAPPLPGALYAFKYDSRRRVGAGLGALMSARWGLYPELGNPHALVPVPLHPRKRRTRGFNQAKLLADCVGERTGLPVLDLLTRRTNDAPQARLGRPARAGRLKRAFKTRAGDLSGARLVLIDDVATSGETLRACAAALVRAGARDVRAFVLAST